LKVRKSVFSDLPRVVQIERAAFAAESYSVTTFLAHVLRDRKGLLVAENNEGRIVGYALVRLGLRWLGVRRGGITSIAVDAAHRRCGFGRALLAAALAYLREHDADEADLEVRVTNRAAQSLYESFGFVPSRELPNYYGPDQPGLKMICDLRESSPAASLPNPGRND
jgi:[ribosomal protein S18]-alanine N-acetyltransferase